MPALPPAQLWFRSHLKAPRYVWSAYAEQNGTYQQYALDLSSMRKGVAWVNGFELGRYWLVGGRCSDSCAPPRKREEGACRMSWDFRACQLGLPTQSLYHVPRSVLRAEGNLVVLFEEQYCLPPSCDPTLVSLVLIGEDPASYRAGH